jgi:type IV pilus assembly protein PilO
VTVALPPLDPKLRQKLIIGALLLFGVSFVYYQYIYSPRSAEVEALRTHLEALETRNQSARALTAGMGEDPEATLAAYRRQLESVEGLIPSGEELPDLLDAISMEAQRSGVEISLIQPSGATEETYYTKRVYDMAVLGRYHPIAEFLTRVASLPRIVTPRDVVLAPTAAAAQGRGVADEIRLEARFSVETYVIPSPTTANAGTPQ